MYAEWPEQALLMVKLRKMTILHHFLYLLHRTVFAVQSWLRGLVKVVAYSSVQWARSSWELYTLRLTLPQVNDVSGGGVGGGLPTMEPLFSERTPGWSVSLKWWVITNTDFLCVIVKAQGEGITQIISSPSATLCLLLFYSTILQCITKIVHLSPFRGHNNQVRVFTLFLFCSITHVGQL